MKVELSQSAKRHVDVIDAWWQANRSSAPELFLEELAAALEALTSVPLTGRMCRVPGVRDARRIVLRATRYHVYYRVARDTVTVIAVWSAIRGTGPSSKDLGGMRAKRPRRT